MKNKKLLIIASVPCEKYQCQYGGATVLVKNMLDYLNDNNVSYDLIVTNKFVNRNTGEEKTMINRCYYLFLLILKVWFCDIVLFQYSDRAVVKLFPKLRKFAHAVGKKVVLRKFGGSFDIYLSKCDEPTKRHAFEALRKTDLIFFETKAGINHLKSYIGEDAPIVWFPNVRKPVLEKIPKRSFNKRLVFMSHIKDEKGVREILEVAKRLPVGYSIDLYGAIKEDKYINFNWDSYGVKYYGQISSEQAMTLLPQYQLLLLLSSYREGYPGIIIEAMSVGVPAVASDIGGIPEIIEDGVNGMLAEVKSVDSLERAILSVTQENYSNLCNNAFESFETNFNSNVVNKRIIDKIMSL